MNNFEKKIFQILQNSRVNKILLFYLIIGVVVYLKDYSSFSYINFFYIGIGHPYILSFFFLPVCFIKSAYILFLIFNNKYIIGRFENRRDLFIFQIKIIFKELNKVFLFFIIIILLCANLFASRNNILLPDPNYSEISNIFGMLFLLIKLYILIITINLISVCTKNLLNNKIYLIISILIIVPFMDFITMEKLGFLLPAHYIGFKYIFSSFKLNVIYSLIYFIIVNIINYLILRKIIIKKDII